MWCFVWRLLLERNTSLLLSTSRLYWIKVVFKVGLYSLANTRMNPRAADILCASLLGESSPPKASGMWPPWTHRSFLETTLTGVGVCRGWESPATTISSTITWDTLQTWPTANSMAACWTADEHMQRPPKHLHVQLCELPMEVYLSAAEQRLLCEYNQPSTSKDYTDELCFE